VRPRVSAFLLLSVRLALSVRVIFLLPVPDQSFITTYVCPGHGGLSASRYNCIECMAVSFLPVTYFAHVSMIGRHSPALQHRKVDGLRLKYVNYPERRRTHRTLACPTAISARPFLQDQDHKTKTNTRAQQPCHPHQQEETPK